MNDPQETEEETSLPLNYYLKNLAQSSFPISISYLCHSLTEFICLCILAQNDENLVGPVAVGMMLCNSLPFAFMYGIADGVGTLTSQAHGAREATLCGEYLNRGIVIVSAILLPWILVMSFVNQLMNLIGFSHEDAVQMGIYLRLTIPYFLSYGITEVFRRFLTAIQIFHVESIIYSSSLGASIFYSYLFISYFNWKIYGAAVAIDLLGITECGLFALYCFKSLKVRPFIANFSNKVWNDWEIFMKFSIPNAIIGMTRNTTETFSNMLGGIFSSLQLEIQSCCLMIILVLFSPIFGISYAMYSFIGNSLGASDKAQAIKWCKISLIVSNLIIFFEVFMTFIFGDELISIFFNSENGNNWKEGSELLKSISFLCGLFFVLKSNLHMVYCIFLSIGKQNRIVTGSIIISLLMIPITIAFSCDFGLNLEIHGLWWGLSFGMFSSLIFYGIMFPKYNWNIIVNEVQERILHDRQE